MATYARMSPGLQSVSYISPNPDMTGYEKYGRACGGAQEVDQRGEGGECASSRESACRLRISAMAGVRGKGWRKQGRWSAEM